MQVHDGEVYVLYEQADAFPDYEMYGRRLRLGNMQIADPDRIMFSTVRFPPPGADDGDDDDEEDEEDEEDEDGEPHQLVFDPSDDFIDVAYYNSKEDCDANQHPVGWYIMKDDAGSMAQNASDCLCHRGLTTDGVETLSIFSCLYPGGKKMALSIFSGEECTVNEMAQIDVNTQDLAYFQGGKCAMAQLVLEGENDKPWTKYVKLEVGQS